MSRTPPRVTIGIDVGGTKIAAGLVDPQGAVLVQVRAATVKHDPEGLQGRLVSLCHELLGDAEALGLVVSGIGLGGAGFADSESRFFRFAPHLDWGEKAVGEELARACGVPVRLDNDANAAAWAEYRFGVGRERPGSRVFAMVALGTGIGGGLVLDGTVARGGFGAGAEFGHMRIDLDGPACHCGRNGCLEALASGDALAARARRRAERGQAPGLLAAAGGQSDAIDGQLVTAAAQGGDRDAIACFDQVGAYLGIGLANLVAVVDPDLVVIGGGVSEAGELLLGPARAAMLADLPGGNQRLAPPVVAAVLGGSGAMVGAGDLARLDAR